MFYDVADEKHHKDDDRMSFFDTYKRDEDFLASTCRPSSCETQSTHRVVSRRKIHVRANYREAVDVGSGLTEIRP